MIGLNKKHNPLYFLCLSVFLLFIPFLGNTQSSNSEQVKRVQRAIFIFNFAEQVTWPNQSAKSEFNIGVLGTDRALIDLKSLSLKRKIKNKIVKVVNFKSVKDIKGIDLLYVNNKSNFDANYILNKIKNKNILLISEDFKYKSTMINMVNVGNTFEYEINTNNINKENLLAKPSLKKYSISSSEKWKTLYKTTEKSLEESKKNEAAKEDVIIASKKSLESNKKTINAQRDSLNLAALESNKRKKLLDKLSQQNNLQQQELKDKLNLEKELEETILSQIEVLKQQEKEIKISEQKLNAQKKDLKNQALEIEKNREIIENKNTKIYNQKKINYLLIGLLLLAALGVFLLFRTYKIKQKSAIALEEKNQAIIKQSLLLEAKNDELEQFAYIASHDLKEPLITISSLIDILVEDYGTQFDKDGQLSLQFVKQTSDRMTKLIDAILAYSKLGKSKTYSKVDCNSIINILKSDLQNVFKRTNATIVIDKLPVINAVPLLIRF